MKIGVIGGGVVGRATARTWLEHCDEVRVWDMLRERSTCPKIYDALQCDIIFVCLPEDQLDKFFSDTGHSVHGTLNSNYVLKSTVPIGTTRRLRDQYRLPNLVHSPEFLTARCAVTDAQMPARNIIGVPEYYNPQTSSGANRTTHMLNEMYKKRFPGVTTYLMRSDESEAVKLAVNSFFAVKVAFWNELRSLCDALHLDWETVREGILSDGRICSSHTQVPGPDGKRGFGGKCLPKDLQHFIEAFHGVDPCEGGPVVADAAYRRNWTIDRKESM